MQLRIFGFLILFFTCASVFALEKKIKKLSPFKDNINRCFEGQLDLAQVKDNKTLYFEITKKFPLQASETTFREVVYTQNTEKRKLVYENGEIYIYAFDREGKIKLTTQDNLTGNSQNTGMRYKVNSLEAKIKQLLNRAKIQSDYTKTSEFRTKQTTLNIVWSDSAIKNLEVLFSDEKTKLDCQKKENVDICECKH